MLNQLIYKSRAKDNLDWENLEKVMDISIKNNKEAELTGMLLFSGEQFLQVLEGEFDKINRAYYNISRDKRHDELELISFGPITKRHFPEWNMRLVNYDTLDPNIREHLTLKYGIVNNRIIVPDDPHLAFSLLFDIYTMDRSHPVTL